MYALRVKMPSNRRSATVLPRSSTRFTVMSSILAWRWTVAKRFVFETTRRLPPTRRSRRSGSMAPTGTGVAYREPESSARIPSPAPGNDRELPVGEDVLAVAEQDEVPVEQPLEEGSRLLDLVERVTGGARARRVDHLRHASAHRLVVTDGRLNVAEHEPNARFELAELLRSEVAAHLEVHHRLAHRRLASMHDPPYAAFGVALGPDHRVVDEPDVEPPCAQLLRHRVDEERRVLAVRLDDRPHGLVPVVGQRRIEHAYRKRRRPPPVGQVESAHDLAEQLLRVQARDEVGRDPPDVRPRELPDGGQTARRHAFGHPREQLLHEGARAGGFALIPGARHASPTS